MQSSALFGVFALAFHLAAVPAVPACDPSDPAFVCGLNHTEDLVRLGETPWVVASQMTVEYDTPPRISGLGPLQAIRIDTREVRRLYPTSESAVDWDRKTYPECPAPPESISSHGLNVRPLGGKKFRLYAVNHGGRESVEIIDVAIHGEQLLTTWRGCIRAPEEGPPEGIWPNSVAPLPGNGVVLSGFHVALWRPGRGWAKPHQLKVGVSNGVEVSRDGRSIFIADTPGRSVIRIPVSGEGEQAALKLNFLPDNLRWGEDGYLYVAGPYWPEGFPVEECFKTPICSVGFAVAQVDPNTFTAKEIFRSDRDGIKREFGAATGALKVGDHFWIGTSRGDRVAILALKP
ncbi:MAG: hypothetical protein HY508_02240 [Acidobacteria bacterium]|nr:hypothetical protein [Acidobacteriota bacterium]